MNSEVDQFGEVSQVVLVIDDSIDVYRLLSARLKGEEFSLIGEQGGAEGIASAKEKKPAVILLDLDMQGMDGFEVLRELKDDPSTMHIPVMALSAMQSRQDKVTAFDLGATDYICKPFDLVELRVRMRSAVRLSVLLQMLSQRAQIDGLTGLFNRAHFDSRWREEVARCQRHGHQLSLAIFDADRFKSINDTYGHPAGDAVLRGIARVLRREIRASDLACRYGGEEFCLIMPDSSPEDANHLCDRIRQGLGEIIWPLHPERRVTVSIGLVGSDGTLHTDAQAWLHQADRNLYQAKNSGRDKVVRSMVVSGVSKAA